MRDRDEEDAAAERGTAVPAEEMLDSPGQSGTTGDLESASAALGDDYRRYTAPDGAQDELAGDALTPEPARFDAHADDPAEADVAIAADAAGNPGAGGAAAVSEPAPYSGAAMDPAAVAHAGSGDSTAARPRPGGDGGHGTNGGGYSNGAGGSTAIAWLALALVLLVAAGGFIMLVRSEQREGDVLARLQGLEALSGRDDSTLTQLGETLRRQIELEVAAASTELRGQMQSDLQTVREQTASSADQMRDQAAALADTVREVQRTQTQVSEGLKELRAGFDERLAQLESQLARQRAQLQQVSTEDESVWMLAEAQYLLRLANQRLIMTGDIDSALALLGSADAVLREFDTDGGLHEVRSVLASDMAALRAVPRVDTQGIHVRLSALMERAAALVAIDPPALALDVDAEQGEDWQARLRRGYQAAVDRLSQYVVVRRREAPIESLIDPQWEQLLQQNVRMLMQQAQIALLGANQSLYEESLQRAAGWLREFFAEDADASAVAAALDELRAEQISVEVPDVARSVRALQDALRRRNRGEEASAS
jgi:uroporphyrin-3 C-methyltransferase